MWNWLSERVTIWVILGALVVAGGLISLLALLFWLTPPAQVTGPVAQLTIIPAPSVTPTVNIVVTPTGAANGEIVDGIGVGMFVQITGTGGDGLRLHDGAGVGTKPRFLGYENEVFRVKEGPKSADGFTWWYLEAPYDPSRVGWAASKYLQVVAGAPTPTP
jgi:hypothetical protein